MNHEQENTGGRDSKSSSSSNSSNSSGGALDAQSGSSALSLAPHELITVTEFHKAIRDGKSQLTLEELWEAWVAVLKTAYVSGINLTRIQESILEARNGVCVPGPMMRLFESRELRRYWAEVEPGGPLSRLRPLLRSESYLAVAIVHLDLLYAHLQEEAKTDADVAAVLTRLLPRRRDVEESAAAIGISMPAFLARASP